MAGKSMLQNSVAELGARIGYARVSTEDQSLEVQLAALQGAGCVKIFKEKESGARSDRPELAAAMAFLREGDTLVITKFDRLARSVVDLLATIKAIVGKGAAFQCLDNPNFNTDNASGELMVTVLGAIAQFERRLIFERCEEGRRAAMAKGIKFGRKQKLNDYQRQEALARLAQGESVRSIARTFGVHYSMISRLPRAPGIEGPAIAISASLIRSEPGAATPVAGEFARTSEPRNGSGA